MKMKDSTSHKHGRSTHTHDFIMNRTEDLSAQAFAQQLRWQLVWLRAIADAWHFPEFRKQLTTKTGSALRKLFKDRYDYDLNKYLDLRIVEVSEKDQKKMRQPGFLPFEMIPNMQLTLYLPPPPDPEHQAIAITDYADAGRVYPFTTW